MDVSKVKRETHWSSAMGAKEEASSDEEPFPLERVPTDEMAKHMFERETKLLKRISHLKLQKQELRAMLTAYQKKELEFVAQMDFHMDEVERTEHALSLRIETLTAQNQQLRTLSEQRTRDNTQLAEKSCDTAKHCSESETRVQFLVDRIVALLSAGSGDTQTDTVVSMRQQERALLLQVDEARQQFDEVRQQNGELTSRLTEELGLSGRLQDQLAEVRIYTFDLPISNCPRLADLRRQDAPRADALGRCRGFGSKGSKTMFLNSGLQPERERERSSVPPIHEAEEVETEPLFMDGLNQPSFECKPVRKEQDVYSSGDARSQVKLTGDAVTVKFNSRVINSIKINS